IVEIKDVISDYWPLILILWGVSILLRKRHPESTTDSAEAFNQTEGEIVHQSEVFGDISLAITSKNFKGGSISTVFGNSNLDLSKTIIADGEYELRVHGIFGDSIITLPKDSPVFISGSSLFGDMMVLGQQKGGFSSDISLKTEQYESSPKRLKITFSKVFGDMKVLTHG
ncbi:MAG: cell wall-active antibiotics response protein, partial [Ignavibacteriae bacterium]|nr:cell wall-active antibiotics response protein [Ignavibacteriota bacterium]